MTELCIHRYVLERIVLSNKCDFPCKNLMFNFFFFFKSTADQKGGGDTQNPRTSQVCSEDNLLAVSLEADVGYGSLVLTTLLVSVLAGDIQVWCPYTQESINAPLKPLNLVGKSPVVGKGVLGYWVGSKCV